MAYEDMCENCVTIALRQNGQCPRCGWTKPTRENHAVHDPEGDETRGWEPEQKATDEAMNIVLSLLEKAGTISQNDLAHGVSDMMNVPLGTARAYVSASLYYFRKAGWAQHVGRDGRSPVWSIDAGGDKN
jgi:hypothetical protein